MSKRLKVVLALFGFGIVVLIAPIAYCAVGIRGYFEGYRCVCGFQNYYFVKNDALWTFSPGHGRKNRLFTLKAHDGIWDAMKDDGELVMQMRLSNGALLEKSPNRPDWQSHARVYNVWGVWLEGLLAKGDDLGEPMRVP